MFVPLDKPQPRNTLLILITDSYGPPYYWSIIETNVGILSACLPTLRPLYRGYRIDSMISKVSSNFNGSGPKPRATDTVRLSSAENSFNDGDSKAMRTLKYDPNIVNHDADFPTHSPKLTV